MSIWSSKRLLAASGLTILAGCAGGLPLGSSAEVTRADLAKGPRGTVTAAAPPGYCIDRRSLRHGPRGGFALMARCDTLGVRSLFPNRRLALITVTTAPLEADAPPPTLEDLEQSVAPAQVIATRRIGALPLVRLANEPGSVEGLAPEHWRGAFALNGQLVALAVYVPDTTPGADSEAADLLADVATRTRAASPTAPSPDTVPKTSPPPVRPRARTEDPGKTGQTAPKRAETAKREGGFISPFKTIAGLFN